MLLAFIPARAGSKGIPKKNLSHLNGKPLIEYTIEAAIKSELIDEIFISTDSVEVKDCAKRMGVIIDYLRPAEISLDETSMFETVEHGLRWLQKKNGQMPDEIILLQPSSPLRTCKDIDEAIKSFRKNNYSFLMSIHPMDEHPYECIVKGDKQSDWKYLIEPSCNITRRQEYSGDYYYINGAIYIARVCELLKYKKFIIPGITGTHLMNRINGIDIDVPSDLNIANALHQDINFY